MSAQKSREIEVKLRVGDAEALRMRLRGLGARRLSRVWERNTLYDTPKSRFRKRGLLLRLRVMTPTAGSGRASGVLTYKGPSLRLEDWDAGQGIAGGRPPGGQRYKVREEVEVEVPNPEKLRELFAAVGLVAAFRYEKIRATYVLPRLDVKLELDETPVGTFIELEGAPRQIDRAARALGYSSNDYITRSYLALHLDACRRRGRPETDMVFSRGRRAALLRRKR
jgi:adenylate cyclase class 2